MKPISIKLVSAKGLEASVHCDGSHDGNDYFSTVSIEGTVFNRKIFGVDPLQSLSLGLQLIEKVTGDKRIGTDDEVPVPGANWNIVVDVD